MEIECTKANINCKESRMCFLRGHVLQILEQILFFLLLLLLLRFRENEMWNKIALIPKGKRKQEEIEPEFSLQVQRRERETSLFSTESISFLSVTLEIRQPTQKNELIVSFLYTKGRKELARTGRQSSMYFLREKYEHVCLRAWSLVNPDDQN